MPLDIVKVQDALRSDHLDGWLLYDFHGSNPIASKLTGMSAGRKMSTRRWFYLIPANGEPRALVHAIERHNLDHLPGQKDVYAGREALDQGLTRLLSGVRRAAMEYSPNNAIPYLSRVDAGTMDLLRHRGVEVVSSGDLVQRFEATWDEAAIQSHRDASERLYRVKDRAFETIRQKVQAGERPAEYDIQQLMLGWFEEEGLVSADPPNVSAQENAGNPHYMAPPTGSRPIGPDELVLVDLWGRMKTPGAVFADITWMGFTGAAIPASYSKAFAAIRDGRDAAIDLVQSAARAGRDLRGWEVDRVARATIERAGYGPNIIHRTGHSLGEEVHGNGVHMDDYETHDDRLLLPGTGFTIEPGVYFDSFGVRTEINMVMGEKDAEVTGPRQQEIVSLV
jgi:Xaa-Pro aminopeptidase